MVMNLLISSENISSVNILKLKVDIRMQKISVLYLITE